MCPAPSSRHRAAGALRASSTFKICRARVVHVPAAHGGAALVPEPWAIAGHGPSPERRSQPPLRVVALLQSLSASRASRARLSHPSSSRGAACGGWSAGCGAAGTCARASARTRTGPARRSAVCRRGCALSMAVRPRACTASRDGRSAPVALRGERPNGACGRCFLENDVKCCLV